jgi:glutaredoxin 3
MEIKMITYTLSWCPHCIALKDFLKSQDCTFEDIDVEKNEDLAEDIIEKTGQSGFPIIEINGEYIIGFDKDKLLKILK